MYLAEDVTSHENYTLKQMRISRDNADMLKLARAEAKLMRSLPPHPHIVRLLASGEEAAPEAGITNINILMEYCPGQNNVTNNHAAPSPGF